MILQDSVGGYPDLLRAVAAHGLAGTLLEPFATPLSDEDFRRVAARVRGQKLTGLFWSAIRDGAFAATPAQREAAEEAHVDSLTAVLLLESLLLETVSLLEGAGVSVRVLKGAAMAHLDYDRTEERTFGDIDLLVPGEAFDETVELLRALGYSRRYPQPRPGFDRRFGKGACLRSSDGLEIDLHRSFNMGPYGERLDLAEIWRSSQPFELGGQRLEALALEARALHAAYHAVLGDRPSRLMPLRDVAQILLTQPVSWPRLHALARACGGEPVLAVAVSSAWSELALADVLAASSWARSFRVSPAASADMAVYGRRASYAATSVRTLRAIDSLAARSKFFLALALPESSYFNDRHQSRSTRLRRGYAAVRKAGGAT